MHVAASRLRLLYAFRVAACIIATSLASCGGREASHGPDENAARDASQSTTDSFAPKTALADATTEPTVVASPDATGPANAAGESDAGAACTVAQCMNLLPFYLADADASEPVVTCCLAGGCIFGAQATATSCSDPDAEVISPSDYDNSCDADSDCVNVAFGNFCYAGANNCALGVIGKKDYPKYLSDVSKTYAAQCFGLSGCPAEFIPCCRNGQCQTDQCISNDDTLLPCSRVGGTCLDSTLCRSPNIGPAHSCAYADETCCLP